MNPTVVELRLHGWPEVVAARVPRRVARRHALALLALLALRDQPRGREAAAALLWPDVDAVTGRGRLRRLVHELHVALGVALVGGDAASLWLAGGATLRVDVDATAVRAAARWWLVHGDGTAARCEALLHPGAHRLLDGFAMASDAFADWLAGERALQQRGVERALARIAEQACAAGDAATAQRAADALLATWAPPATTLADALLARLQAIADAPPPGESLRRQIDAWLARPAAQWR